MDLKEEDNKFFGRGGQSMELEVTKAKGSLIYDREGKKYIDFLGGSGVSDLGWGEKEIESQIRNDDRPSYVYPHFYYRPWVELAKLLEKITPGNLQKSFRTTGGSEAVEAAMQMAMMYTGRKKFLSIEGSYHGNTLGALSIGASSRQEKFPNLLGGCEKIDLPLNAESLEKIEDKLKENEVAAFIMEPVIVNVGVYIPEPGFMEELEKMCRQYGTLLVMDEAITGFGRTGKFFATEHYNIKPDILCMAKALSAGHAGIGAVITTKEVAEKVEGKIGLYSSYGWHPVSVEAAITNITYLLNNHKELFQQIEKTSHYYKQALEKLPFPENTEFRIKGLAIAIDLKDEKLASQIKRQCFENGLLMNTENSSLLFLPALNIEKEVVQEGIDILKYCLEEIFEK